MSLQFSYPAIAAICLALYFIIGKLFSSIEAHRFSKANGCKPPAKLPQSERILGLANFKAQRELSKSKLLLPASNERFQVHGNTYTVAALGKTIIITIEPQNVKTILSTSFNHYGLGMRLRTLGVFLGAGIFTSDGKQWEHSRVRICV